MEYSGYAPDGTRSCSAATASRRVRRLLAAGRTRAAGMNVNVWDVNEHVQALIRSRQPVDLAALADPDTRLIVLVGPAREIDRRTECHRTPISSACTMRASRSGSTRSRASCSKRRVRRADPRLQRHRRDLEPDDLRQGDHRLGPLRRAAAGAWPPTASATRRSCSSRWRSTTSARPPASCAPTYDHERRARRLHLLRVHPRPRRRHRGHDRAGDRPLAAARPAQRDDQGPGHPAGLQAIEELTRRGINVNVTLLFSIERYEQVIDAYLRGLDRSRERGSRSTGSRSVASFFLSRIDTEVDAQLPEVSPLRGQSRSPPPASPTSATSRSSPGPIGSASSASAPARSGRCGRAPGPRTPPTPTSSTSPS